MYFKVKKYLTFFHIHYELRSILLVETAKKREGTCASFVLVFFAITLEIP